MEHSLLLSRARAALIARDFTLATRLYRQLLRNKPNDIELLQQLGDLYMKSDRDDQALSVFKRISELNREDPKPLITIGGIYRRLKQYEDSIIALEHALALDGTDPQISYNLGFTYKVMGQLDDAIDCFEDAIEMNPNDVLAYNHLGTIYAERGDNDKAVQSYTRGLNVDANHPILQLNIAKSYEALGEYDKSSSAYEGALRSRPLWIDAIDGYARLLVRVGKPKDAYNLVNRAIAVNPKDQKLLLALDNVKKYVSQDTLATVTLQTVPEASPEIPSNFEELGKVDDSEEFNSNGLEIQMNDEETSLMEDQSFEDSEGFPEEKDQNGFDFTALGMDQLANDQPLDEMFFEKADEAIMDAESAGNRLDSLVDDSDAPLDYGEVPDPAFADEDIFESPESSPVMQLMEEAPYTEEKTLEPAEQEIEIEPEETPEEITEEEDIEETPDFSAETEELERLKDELAQQVEKAQQTLEQANYAAEQAWEAAQQAADSAQFLEAAKNAIDSAQNNPEDMEKYREQLSMFCKLRDLLNFLPEEKKEQFLTSRTRVLLDYIIAKLSGAPGLFASVNKLIASGAIVLPEFPENNELSDQKEDVIKSGLNVLQSLVLELKDERLKKALLEELWTVKPDDR